MRLVNVSHVLRRSSSYFHAVFRSHLMMTFLKYLSVTRWILKLQLPRTKPFCLNMLTSPFIFCGPIVGVGYLLGKRFGYDLFTTSITLSLVWIALAPFLIQWVFKLVVDLFSECKAVFKDEDVWEKLREQELSRIKSWKYWLFGVPWGALISYLVFQAKFLDAPLPIQAWAILSFAFIFLVSSIGFYGVYVLITMMAKVLGAGINFDPFHPDRFGGIAFLGNFTVKAALAVSSGALMFPLAYEVAEGLGRGPSFLKTAGFMSVGLFVLVMLASFLIPLFQIKAFADKKKAQIAIGCRSKLKDMMAKFRRSDKLNTKLALELFMYYYLACPRLSELRSYPVDIRVLLELAASFAVPIGVAVLQALS